MEYRVEKTGDAALMELEGELTIQHAGAFKAALKSTMSDANRLVLDLARVTGVDLSCLQLLCTAHRAFLERNKELSLSPDQGVVFTRLVSDSGYARMLGCHKDPHKSCLWKGVRSNGQDHNNR